MSDINKYIGNEDGLQKDPHGYLMDLEPWSEDIANRLAGEDGITLTPQHWDVIKFVRDHYREHGPARSARDITRVLEERFAAVGGKKYLYQLFPQGPVRQSSRIAGLPVPPHSTNPSFGSVE